MRPLPFWTISVICAAESRALTPSSEGACASLPSMFGPWQTAHWADTDRVRSRRGCSARERRSTPGRWHSRRTVRWWGRRPVRPTPPRRRSRERPRCPCRTSKGANCPSLFIFSNFSRAHWWTSGVRLVSRSRVSNCRANGTGFVGIGWVSAVTSPSTCWPDTCGTRSERADSRWCGRTGTPGACLVACATASIVFPSRLTVTSTGGAGRSRSQISCFTTWKCQIRFPVAASSAIRQLANRLSPVRLAP